jgi:hypothetical protein
MRAFTTAYSWGRVKTATVTNSAIGLVVMLPQGTGTRAWPL